MQPRSFVRLLALASLGSTALFAALPAQALGRLADVQVIDRDSGEVLTLHRHKGEHWVAGRPGARYAVAVRNATSGRIMTVVSVDGVNVVTGETAAWQQNGYVLSPWQPYDITGWRKSDAEVAAFHFTSLSDAYATRTGRPDHLGVIGVAVFREKAPAVLLPQPQPFGQHRETERLSQNEAASGAPPAAPAAAAAESAADSLGSSRDSTVASRRMAPQAAAPRLGTGHGERESAWVGQTTFERRSQRPDETISIRYDSRDNLIAMGIISATPVPPRPNPFPAAAAPRYVPDPS